MKVLPTIRKQGGYMVARADESDEVIMARALQIMQATLERRDAEIARLTPRAAYADHVLDSVSCFTTTQVAKGMGMTADIRPKNGYIYIAYDAEDSNTWPFIAK